MKTWLTGMLLCIALLLGPEAKAQEKYYIDHPEDISKDLDSITVGFWLHSMSEYQLEELLKGETTIKNGKVALADPRDHHPSIHALRCCWKIGHHKPDAQFVTKYVRHALYLIYRTNNEAGMFEKMNLFYEMETRECIKLLFGILAYIITPSSFADVQYLQENGVTDDEINQFKENAELVGKLCS